MRLAVLLVIGLSACGDNLSLVVDVTHRIPVARTVISVYESDSVDCTKIEFGDLDAAALSAALVAEEIHDAGGVTGSLDGISRTESKYVVARGYDTDGTLLTAGCATKGIVTGIDHLAVDADEALTVSAISDTSDMQYGFLVLASAPNGSPPTAHRKIAWQVYGPDGTVPIRSDLADMVPPEPNQPQQSDWVPKLAACTNNSGVTRIHPVPPHQIGGFVTRIRASWAANELPLQSALSKVDPAAIANIRPPAGVTHACAVKVSGGVRRLVCLDSAGLTNYAREYTVSPNGSRFIAMETNFVTLPGPATPVTLISVPAGSGVRDVYMIDTAGNAVPMFATPGAQTLSACPLGACAVTDALYAPACTDDNEAKIYFLMSGTTTLRTLALGTNRRDVIITHIPTGTSIAGTLDSIALDQAGCVTQIVPKLGPKQRQAVTFSAKSTLPGGSQVTSSHGFYGCIPGPCSKLDFPVGEAGTTFVQLDPSDNRIIGASADAGGVVLSSWVVIPDPDVLVHRLLERDRVPSASIPHRIVAGKLDNDAGFDMVWDFATKRGTTLEIAYSRMAAGQRLEAVSNPQPLLFSDLLLDDFTNDGFVDLIAVGALGGMVAVGIVPTHVAPFETTVVAEQCK